MSKPDEIRAWARSKGLKIGDRGRISAQMRAAYELENVGAKVEGCSPTDGLPKPPSASHAS